MKSMIYQFYNEGFANIFRIKPINYINSKVKNKKTIRILSFIISFLYTILILLFIILLLYFKYC